jgi:hypothetical protein
MDENEEVKDEFEGVKLWWSIKKNTPKNTVNFCLPGVGGEEVLQAHFP